jgi:hypothetical protein
MRATSPLNSLLLLGALMTLLLPRLIGLTGTTGVDGEDKSVDLTDERIDDWRPSLRNSEGKRLDSEVGFRGDKKRAEADLGASRRGTGDFSERGEEDTIGRERPEWCVVCGDIATEHLSGSSFSSSKWERSTLMLHCRGVRRCVLGGRKDL